jgi:hypothetical protein
MRRFLILETVRLRCDRRAADRLQARKIHRCPRAQFHVSWAWQEDRQRYRSFAFPDACPVTGSAGHNVAGRDLPHLSRPERIKYHPPGFLAQPPAGSGPAKNRMQLFRRCNSSSIGRAGADNSACGDRTDGSAIRMKIRDLLRSWQVALLFSAAAVLLVWKLWSPPENKLLTDEDCYEALERMFARRLAGAPPFSLTPEEESNFKACEPAER